MLFLKLAFLVQFLPLRQSCFASRIPAKAHQVQDPVRRQNILCQEQIFVTKILVLVPVCKSQVSLRHPLTPTDPREHVRYLKYDLQNRRLLQTRHNKRTDVH